MLRQASSRNQRSKGFKAKHALQIGLLVAICIWLLYQVKHSHEKKRAFEERSSKFLNKEAENQADFFKFGRKDLPHIEETVSVTETHKKEEENEETQEEEHDSKQEEIDDEEGRGAGDDEIDEQDQEKGDEEAENGEESSEEEDKDSRDEDKDGHEEVDVFDNQEHEGGTQEAREENYKSDDASSAVVHDTHVTKSESTGGARHADEEQGNTDEEQVVDNVDDESSANGSKGDGDANTDGSKSEVVLENMTNGTDDGSRSNSDLSAGSGGAFVSIVSDTVLKNNETIQTDNLPSNTTAADNKNEEVDNKDIEVEFSKPDNGTVSNSTTVEYNSQMEQQTILTTEAVPNTQRELQTNPTGGVSDQQTEMQNNSTVADTAGISASTDTVNLDSAQNQNVAADNATVGEDVHDSQFVADPTEKSNTTTGLESKEHSITSAMNENGDAAQGESDNSLHAAVITKEEKDAHTDLSTSPEIQNEVKKTDEAAE